MKDRGKDIANLPPRETNEADRARKSLKRGADQGGSAKTSWNASFRELSASRLASYRTSSVDWGQSPAKLSSKVESASRIVVGVGEALENRMPRVQHPKNPTRALAPDRRSRSLRRLGYASLENHHWEYTGLGGGRQSRSSSRRHAESRELTKQCKGPTCVL